MNSEIFFKLSTKDISTKIKNMKRYNWMDDSSLFMRIYIFKGLIDIKEEVRTKNISRPAAETGKQHFPSRILSI